MEEQKKIEIGKYASPEDLALALEEKSKEVLAQKIRSISTQVQGNSIELRKQLQESLTAVEQKEIREALPSSGVETVFSKGLTPEEKATKEAMNIVKDIIPGGEKTTQGLSKLEKWFKSISDSFDKAEELFGQGKIAAALGVLVMGLFGKFSHEEWQNGGKNPFDKKENNKENSKEQSKSELKYLGGVELLFLMKGEKSKDYTKTILLQQEIKSKSYNELSQIYGQGKEGIAQRLGMSNKGSDEQVFEALTILAQSEEMIQKTLGKVSPDWREKELGTVLLALNSKGSALTSIYKKVTSAELSTNPLDSFNKLANIDILSINIDPKTNSIDFGDLEDRKELIAGVDKTSLAKIMRGEKIKDPNDAQQKERFYGLTGGAETDKAFVDKLFVYQPKIVHIMSRLFGETDAAKYEAYFATTGISPKDLVELYLITGDNPDFNHMDAATKSLVYLKTWKLLGNDKLFRGENFDRKLVEAFTQKDIIPEDVKAILINIFGKTANLLVDGVTGALKEIYGALTPAQLSAIGAVFALGLVALYYLGPIRLAALSVTISSIVSMVAMFLHDTHLRDKYSEQNLKRLIEDSLKQKGVI